LLSIILDGVQLSRRATSTPDTDSASSLLLFFVATLCVNKDVHRVSKKHPLILLAIS